MSVKRVLKTVDTVYRSESRRVLATLIRLIGDFEFAEEALHDAFVAVLAVAFELNGQPFTALNGGPMFTYNGERKIKSVLFQ